MIIPPPEKLMCACMFPALSALKGHGGLDVCFFDMGKDLNISRNNTASMFALSGTDIAFMDYTNNEICTYHFDGKKWSQMRKQG